MKLRDAIAFLVFASASGPAGLVAQTPATFLLPRTFGSPSSGGAVAMAVADFNRDGALDAAIVGNDVTVYLGDGRGSFTAKPPLGFAGSGIVAADFNGDGIPDLAICASPAISESSGITVLFGNGDGTFRSPVTYAGSFTVLAVGDFNGDGHPDIAAGTASAQFQIFFGSATGSFTPGPVTAVSTGNPEAIVSADFNGDSKADVAVSGKGTFRGVAVFAGNGDGTFQKPASTYQVPSGSALPSLVVADFNRDGLPDLAYAAETPTVGILLNTGKGFTAATPVQMRVSINALATADLNRDGIPDLVVEEGGVAGILFGRGDGTFHLANQYVLAGGVEAIAIADFNRDGQLDILAANGGSFDVAEPPLALLLGEGKGQFQSSRVFNGGEALGNPAVADFNRDGNLDVAVSSRNNSFSSIAVLMGDGHGGLAQPVNYPANSPTAVAVTDANLDGQPDIVFVGDNCVGTLPGKPGGTFGPAIYTPCTGCSSPLLVADFNHDGKPDLITFIFTAFNESRNLALLLGKGDGTFAPPVTFGPYNPAAVAAADFNNDGYPDLIVSNSNNTFATYLMMNNRDGTFAPPALFNDSYTLGVVGDFNSDGNIDIALGAGVIYFGNGDGTFTPEYDLAAPMTPVLAADFNGDGIPDLFGYNGGLGMFLLGLGNGDFIQQTQLVAAANQPAAGDFNNDGKLDLVTVTQGTVWLVLNTTSP